MKKQYESVIEVMRENGGYSTLGHLYQNVLKVAGSQWKTKTPFASIRRIVQDNRFFFRIRPGLWALKESKDRLPPEIFLKNKSNEKERTQYNHSYYQGLILEIGNLKNLKTFVPSQDKNHKYLDSRLGEVATLKVIPSFTYPNLIKKAQTVDVVWFNDRNLPHSFFEIEHSTNIHNSLLKFVELQDFHSAFHIVADNVRAREFKSKISLSAFHPIAKNTKFVNYDQVSEWHTKVCELTAIEATIITQ